MLVNREVQGIGQQLASSGGSRERASGGHEHRVGEAARPGAQYRIE
jgi:hypothetical protein